MADHHEASAHTIEGSPHEQMRRVLARHLCGWISGHGAPVDHFLGDADLILRDAHEQGIRFHLAADDWMIPADVPHTEVQCSDGSRWICTTGGGLRERLTRHGDLGRQGADPRPCGSCVPASAVVEIHGTGAGSAADRVDAVVVRPIVPR